MDFLKDMLGRAQGSVAIVARFSSVLRHLVNVRDKDREVIY